MRVSGGLWLRMAGGLCLRVGSCGLACGCEWRLACGFECQVAFACEWRVAGSLWL